MKMRNRNEAPAAILAGTEVFDYLKEKVGERKTRTEAYCDLLDKSLAGFVSPFLRRQDYDLSPCQCHVTVSDLASEWHWHRATVRSFLDTLEALGQLERIRLAKSVVITMPLRTGTPAMPDSGREEADFATRIQEALYDWIIGKATSFDVGKSCGQIMRKTLTEIAGRDSRIYPDSHSDTASAQTVRSEEQLCETVLECIAHAALWRVLRKSRFDDGSPLVQFFRLDLSGEWAAFIEASKELAELVIDGKPDGTGFGTDEETERLESLRKPFLSLLAKAQEEAERGFADRDCITTGNSPRFRFKYPSSYSRHPGLPVCHRTKGRGSLIPLLTDVAGRSVQASSKLGHGELSETTRKQYGKCKTGSRCSGIERDHRRPRQRTPA